MRLILLDTSDPDTLIVETYPRYQKDSTSIDQQTYFWEDIMGIGFQKKHEKQ